MEDRDLMPFYAQARRIAERAMGEIRRLEARMAAVTSSLKLGYDDAAQPPSDAQRHDIRSLLVEIEAKRDAAREDIERAVIGRLPEDASGDDKRRLGWLATPRHMLLVSSLCGATPSPTADAQPFSSERERGVSVRET